MASLEGRRERRSPRAISVDSADSMRPLFWSPLGWIHCTHPVAPFVLAPAPHGHRRAMDSADASPPRYPSTGPRPHLHKACPPAFAETFVRWGWRGVERAFGARTDINKRWLTHCGGEELRQARLRYLAQMSALRAEKARREAAMRRCARARHEAIPAGMPCL